MSTDSKNSQHTEQAIINLQELQNLEEITNYAHELTNKLLAKQISASEIIKELITIGCSSYIFSIAANSMGASLDLLNHNEIENELLDILNGAPKNRNNDCAFAAYYLTTYYYFRLSGDKDYAVANEALMKLKDIIEKYEKVFLTTVKQKDQYPLIYQIRGRYLRRIGKNKEALNADRQVLDILKARNIENEQVYITYTATVAEALEDREDYITLETVKFSLEQLDNILENTNPLFGRGFCVRAKMRIFLCVSSNQEINTYLKAEDEFKLLELARADLNKAIELESKQSMPLKDKNLKTCYDYLRQIEFVASEVRMRRKLNETCNAIHEELQASINELTNTINETNYKLNKWGDIDSRFESNKKDYKERIDTEKALLTNKLNSTKSELIETIKEKIRNEQNRYLEILAIFVSIVSIVIVFIGSLSVEFPIFDRAVFLILTMASIMAIYSIFLLLLRENHDKKYINTFLISCFIIICIIVFLYFDRTDRKINEATTNIDTQISTESIEPETN